MKYHQESKGNRRSVWADILLIPAWVGFFVVQVTWNSEIGLTAVVCLLTLVLLWRRERGEGVLYAIGVALGLVIEVGLGMVFRMQHWSNASLAGVPYWLPLIWGFGFVAMRRIGNAVVAYAGRGD